MLCRWPFCVLPSTSLSFCFRTKDGSEFLFHAKDEVKGVRMVDCSFMETQSYNSDVILQCLSMCQITFSLSLALSLFLSRSLSFVLSHALSHLPFSLRVTGWSKGLDHQHQQEHRRAWGDCQMGSAPAYYLIHGRGHAPRRQQGR